MVWRVTNEPVDCRPSRGTNKHTQDRKKCSLLDDNSTATADYDSAHANYTVNYIRQLQNHDYIHMTTTTSYQSILLHVTQLYSLYTTMQPIIIHNYTANTQYTAYTQLYSLYNYTAYTQLYSLYTQLYSLYTAI